MAVVRGALALLSVDGDIVAGDQSCSASVERELTDYTTKSQDATGREYEDITCSLSGDTLLDTADGGTEAMTTALFAGTKVAAVFTFAMGVIQGTFLVESMEFSGEKPGMQTGSYTLQSDLDVTFTPV
jgi:TP901-1 family phage major tail protein